MMQEPDISMKRNTILPIIIKSRSVLFMWSDF